MKTCRRSSTSLCPRKVSITWSNEQTRTVVPIISPPLLCVCRRLGENSPMGIALFLLADTHLKRRPGQGDNLAQRRWRSLYKPVIAAAPPCVFPAARWQLLTSILLHSPSYVLHVAGVAACSFRRWD